MESLKKILKNVDVISVTGSLEIRVGNICFDSRKLVADDVYVAVKGTQVNGHNFISDVVKKGVLAIVCEEMPVEIKMNCSYIKVRDSHKALAIMSSNYYDHPSEMLNLVGVTGTNGKTTIASLLYSLFTDLGYKCGLLSTIQTLVAGKPGLATHTTPDPLQINSLLSEMTKAGCEFVFMEVSSHAADQKRIAGLLFRGGIFTNLSHDHLDYHKDFMAYRDAKKSFFDNLPPTAFALVNADDKNGGVMIQNTKAKTYTYGIKSMADFRVKVLESHFAGNLLQISNKELWTRLPGVFNAYNIIAIYGAAKILGAGEDQILENLSKQESVNGRFQIIRSKEGITAIVDYAHTPDALEKVLLTIREISTSVNRIITIVGAGGNRDKTKRPLMAHVAAELSDKVVLTSDNPRDEEPESIINDMKSGLDKKLMKKVISITDREEAIKAICAFAGKYDIILIAGKGHETYQEIKGRKKHFDDRELVKKYFENK
jgi:UDP-N-acetylmuramoyl-L-alanyl-D-glutamate--2,6-diaminopimelate ligase